MTQHPPHPQQKENIADEKFQMELTGYEIQQVLKAVGTATSLWAKNRRQCPASVDTGVLMTACDKIAHATDPQSHTTPASHQRIDWFVDELIKMKSYHDGQAECYLKLNLDSSAHFENGLAGGIQEAIALLREGESPEESGREK